MLTDSFVDCDTSFTTCPEDVVEDLGCTLYGCHFIVLDFLLLEGSTPANRRRGMKYKKTNKQKKTKKKQKKNTDQTFKNGAHRNISIFHDTYFTFTNLKLIFFKRKNIHDERLLKVTRFSRNS